METSEEIKKEVKKKYGDIAVKNESCCGSTSSCCGTETEADWTMTDEKYKELKGYNPDADLKLGCGMPTEYARIEKGQTVVDLGSGAGNDVFIAHALTGETGKVIGVDFTTEMIQKANANKEKLGFKNIDFVYGEIENIPLAENTADVVISNCVLNLVPDKKKAFAEIFRILKPGGHLSISDIVTTKPLPESLQKPAELYAGCISGAITKIEYLDIIHESGMTNIKIDREKEVILPYELLKKYLKEDEIKEYLHNGSKILSINVYAEKH